MKMRFKDICKREICRLPRLVIAALGLAITALAILVAFPIYLVSLLMQKRSINSSESHGK